MIYYNSFIWSLHSPLAEPLSNTCPLFRLFFCTWARVLDRPNLYLWANHLPYEEFRVPYTPHVLYSPTYHNGKIISKCISLKFNFLLCENNENENKLLYGCIRTMLPPPQKKKLLIIQFKTAWEALVLSRILVNELQDSL